MVKQNHLKLGSKIIGKASMAFEIAVFRVIMSSFNTPSTFFSFSQLM